MLEKAVRAAEAVIYYASGALMLSLTGVILYAVVARYFFNAAPAWSDEVPRVLFLSDTYIGSGQINTTGHSEYPRASIATPVSPSSGVRRSVSSTGGAVINLASDAIQRSAELWSVNRPKLASPSSNASGGTLTCDTSGCDGR